jgi:hypothetical protein
VPIRTSECGVEGETLLLERSRGLKGRNVSFGDKPVKFTEGQRKGAQLPPFLTSSFVTSMLISTVYILCFIYLYIMIIALILT